VVPHRFVGSALTENFVTFTATVTDANGNQSVADTYVPAHRLRAQMATR
jgi:hypothetical protein